MTGNGLSARSLERQVTLLETLDRLLSRGVVVAGDLTLAVADVDLIYVGLRLLISSVETARLLGVAPPRPPHASGVEARVPAPSEPPPPEGLREPGTRAGGVGARSNREPSNHWSNRTLRGDAFGELGIHSASE